MSIDRKLTERLGMEGTAEVEVFGLQYAAAAAESSRLELCHRRQSVWHELQIADPALVDEMRGLGGKECQAAAWLCEPQASGRPPIAMLIHGDREEVLRLVQRGTEGLGGAELE